MRSMAFRPLLEDGAEAALTASGDLGGNVGHSALALDQLPHGVGVVNLVRQYDAALRQAGEQRLRRLTVSSLARRHEEGERSPLGVCKGVELGVTTASGGADDLSMSLPLPPVAERYVLT